MEHADAPRRREAAEAGTTTGLLHDHELWLSRTSAPCGVVKGQLDKDGTAITEHALRLAHRPDAEGSTAAPPAPGRRPGRRRQHYVDHHTSITGNRRQERLGVACDISTLYGNALRGAGSRRRQLEHVPRRATRASARSSAACSCEAFDGAGDVARTLDGNPIGDGLLSCVSEGGVLERLLTVDGRVIDHGRALRTHTASQWRALADRDGGCRFPGCPDPVDGTHVHHVERWEAGGSTDLRNGVLLSPHCHTIVSQPGGVTASSPTAPTR